MSLVFTTDGYFCEGQIVQKKWQYQMELGKVLLSEENLSLLRRSNISLTGIGASVDDYKEGFKIPLTNIKKVYPLKFQNIFLITVETRDNLIFSISMATNKNNGRESANYLSELINSTILKSINLQNLVPKENICNYCKEKMDPSANFCRHCGKERI
ncbi:MAG: zinc ribbon domain-containing protein [Candidatus Lokiarchaeota archaeon]|nr:zinc ribbon domain-containing protein [Candidatus Lokiarchaeota archaeon]